MAPSHLSGRLKVVIAALIAIAGLLFDAATPQMVSSGTFYAGLVLFGAWFAHVRAALVLATIGTLLIIIGYWIAIPDEAPEWEAWSNRALEIATVWMTGMFVWRIRVLDQRLQAQVELVRSLSREMNHRVGNHLQFVASFLNQQARNAGDAEARRILELASSRVMVIGEIQRMLAHGSHQQMVDARAFVTALVQHVKSALPDPDRIVINVEADSAELSSTTAIALGSLLIELMNNALKHAFRNNISGRLDVSFVTSHGQYVLNVADDGVGIDEEATADSFGMRSIADLVRLIGGTITRGPARSSDKRPGTVWRVTMPVSKTQADQLSGPQLEDRDGSIGGSQMQKSNAS